MAVSGSTRRDRRASRASRTRPIFPERTPHPFLNRVTRWAARSPLRVRGRNPFLLATSVLRRFSEVRATGLAAEMAFFLVLSLLPLVTAIGAGIGVLGAVLTRENLQAVRGGATGVVELVLGAQLADQVAVPLLDDLLVQQEVTLAVVGTVVALLLGSRVFRSALGALGEAVQIPERRGFWRLWSWALLLTLLAVVTVTAVLSLVVVGPLFGGGEAVAELVGAGALVSWTWSLGRWPVAVAIAWGFLVVLYRLGQRERGWRQVMPGAAAATVALLLLTSGFRLYLAVAPPGGATLGDPDDAASTAGLFIVTSLAVMLYAWLSSLLILGGGIVNVELASSGEPARAARAGDVGLSR